MSAERDAAAIRHPAVCDATRFKRGCVCEKCRAHDASLVAEEREQRIKEANRGA